MTPIVSSACIPVRVALSCTGGCISSPEDKVCVPCPQGLIILSPKFIPESPNCSISSHVTQVFLKQRTEALVDLKEATVLEGTSDPKESDVAFAECANRSVLFPLEEIYRDTLRLREGSRCVDWSPRGVDRFGRCVMAAVTLDGRATICAAKGADAWEEASYIPDSIVHLINLSGAWQQYYVTEGRVAKAYPSVLDERPNFSPTVLYAILARTIFTGCLYVNFLTVQGEQQNHRNYLTCDAIAPYLDAIEDVNCLRVSWSHIPRRPQVEEPLKLENVRPVALVGLPPTSRRTSLNHLSKPVAPMLLLAVLLRSGTIVLWGVNLPLTGPSSLFLVYVDYSYAVMRKSELQSDKKKAVFLKFCDLDATHAILVLVLSDGSVVGVVYDLHFSSEGSFWIQLSHKLSFCTYPIMHTPVLACAWSMSDGLLCLGYGRHLLVSQVKVIVRENTVRRLSGVIAPTYQVVYDYLTKPDESHGCITGVYLEGKVVYITTLDGYLARLNLENAEKPPFHWNIIWTHASCPNPEQLHWEFHGLSVSSNGAYICFVENPVNYLDNTRQLRQCVYVPQVRFLSFWTNEQLLELLFTPKLPLNRKFDALQQLYQRWLNLQPDEDRIDIRAECLKRLEFTSHVSSEHPLPSSWLEQPLSSLQLYRLLLKLLTADANQEMKERASTWQTYLDDLIRDRNIDRCFRLFLESSVQRQAVDCILVIRMATVVLDWLNDNSIDRDSFALPCSTKAMPGPSPRCLLPTIGTMAKQAACLARQLYVHRFNLPSSDLPSGPLLCPICSENILFGFCLNPFAANNLQFMLVTGNYKKLG
ncbi:hypothetical protein AHF37_01759 [Paragonimus kellicotti]|nr:hypothetical protein AHF37_01759 [Paragonimus kellicotti]